MAELPQPTSQLSEVLYVFLTTPGRVSHTELYEATRLKNYGQRISDLRKLGLELPCVELKGTNKFGRPISWGTWSINGQREAATEIYHKLISRKK